MSVAEIEDLPPRLFHISNIRNLHGILTGVCGLGQLSRRVYRKLEGESQNVIFSPGL
jgi:hypothetical protein